MKILGNPNHPKAEKEKDDNARLLRAWKKFHRDALVEALVSLHRGVMSRLTAHLKQLRSARELVEFIEAQNWGAVDAHTRLVALHEINEAITELRKRLGQPPIDDALPGEPLRAFQLIRQIINPVSHVSGEASPVGMTGQMSETGGSYE